MVKMDQNGKFWEHLHSIGEVISKTRGAAEVGSIRSITTDIEAWPVMVVLISMGLV